MEKAIVIKGKASEIDKIVKENAIRVKMGLITIGPQPEKNVSSRKKTEPEKDSKEVLL